jgi:hypothetical protein
MAGKNWKILSRALKLVGFGGCLVDFVLSISLIAYYSVTRPHVPQPAREWDVKLYWSFIPPSYGTAGENEFLLSMHWWFFSFFVLICLAELIRIYVLEPTQGMQ